MSYGDGGGGNRSGEGLRGPDHAVPAFDPCLGLDEALDEYGYPIQSGHQEQVVVATPSGHRAIYSPTTPSGWVPTAGTEPWNL